MAVWGGNVGSPRYRTWDGTVWSSAQSITMAGGATRWLAVASNPMSASNEVMLTTIDTNNDVSVVRWDGTSWTGASTVETNASSNNSAVVDIAYQPDGARAVLAWHADGEDRLKYRVWNGSTWSGTGATADFASRPMSVHLATGRTPDRVTMGVRRQGVATYNDYVMYSDGGTVSEGSATVVGAVGQNEPGVSLPTPPSGTANSSHVIVGNNSSQTVTPGTYGRLETGNSSTVNFSGAGTYIFEFFKANFNTATFNFATGGGDITVIFSNGSFTGKNNLTMNSTGGGRVRIHVKNGNFEIDNNSDLNSPELYVYNGNISLGTNTSFQGAMYASGNVTVGSGSVTLGTGVSTGPGRLSAMVWENGVAGAVTEIATALHGTGQVQPFAFTSTPLARGLSVSRWREVGADE
jgi:hypothetical protein